MDHLSKNESREVVEDDIHISIQAGGGQHGYAEREYDWQAATSLVSGDKPASSLRSFVPIIGH
jgi:hypothetical protein